MTVNQRELAPQQVREFHHDQFVNTQLEHFRLLFPSLPADAPSLVDIGGGVGHFARAVSRGGALRVTVLDTDPQSVAHARNAGLNAQLGDALTTRAGDAAAIVAFNLILHHLVADAWGGTLQLQRRALANQLTGSPRKRLFVNEYVYESYGYVEFAPRMIFSVTSAKVLSWLAGTVAAFVPSLRANTFGVGVCFHSDQAWRRLFAESGWQVERAIEGELEPIAWPRRLALGLCRCRRNSYLLRPAQPLQ